MPAVLGSSSISPTIAVESLENAAKEVDRQLQADRQYPDLAEQLRISSGGRKFLLDYLSKIPDILNILGYMASLINNYLFPRGHENVEQPIYLCSAALHEACTL